MSCQVQFFIIAKQANQHLTLNQPLSVKCMAKRCQKRMLLLMYVKRSLEQLSVISERHKLAWVSVMLNKAH